MTLNPLNKSFKRNKKSRFLTKSKLIAISVFMNFLTLRLISSTPQISPVKTEDTAKADIKQASSDNADESQLSEKSIFLKSLTTFCSNTSSTLRLSDFLIQIEPKIQQTHEVKNILCKKNSTTDEFESFRMDIKENSSGQVENFIVFEKSVAVIPDTNTAIVSLPDLKIEYFINDYASDGQQSLIGNFELILTKIMHHPVLGDINISSTISPNSDSLILMTEYKSSPFYTKDNPDVGFLTFLKEKYSIDTSGNLKIENIPQATKTLERIELLDSIIPAVDSI